MGDNLGREHPTGRLSLLQNMADVNGVVEQDGVRQQAQAAGFIHDFEIVARPELALIGKEGMAGKLLAEFASIQL